MNNELSELYNTCSLEEKDILLSKFSNKQLGISEIHYNYNDEERCGWYYFEACGKEYISYGKLWMDRVLRYHTDKYRMRQIINYCDHIITKKEFDDINNKRLRMVKMLIK